MGKKERDIKDKLKEINPSSQAVVNALRQKGLKVELNNWRVPGHPHGDVYHGEDIVATMYLAIVNNEGQQIRPAAVAPWKGKEMFLQGLDFVLRTEGQGFQAKKFLGKNEYPFPTGEKMDNDQLRYDAADLLAVIEESDFPY